MRWLARWLQLDSDQRATLALAVVLLGALPVLLRIVGLRRARGALARLVSPGRGRCIAGADPALRVARLVDIAARRGPFRPACLARALALQCLLRLRGLETELRIGVRQGADGLEAHAWLETGGIPILEATDVGVRFPVLERAALR